MSTEYDKTIMREHVLADISHAVIGGGMQSITVHLRECANKLDKNARSRVSEGWDFPNEEDERYLRKMNEYMSQLNAIIPPLLEKKRGKLNSKKFGI